IVHAIGIGFDHRAHFRGEVGFIPRFNRLPYAHQIDEIIGNGSLFALHGGELSARGDNDFLNGREIIFRMGIANAEGDIDIALARYMGNAPFIPFDQRIEGLGPLDEGGRIGSGGGFQRAAYENDGKHHEKEREKPQKSRFQNAHIRPLMFDEARVAGLGHASNSMGMGGGGGACVPPPLSAPCRNLYTGLAFSLVPLREKADLLLLSANDILLFLGFAALTALSLWMILRPLRGAVA